MLSAINTNLNALAAQRQLSLGAASLGSTIQRLSSGLRVNSAKDDAAGLAISERFTTQIKGVDQAARNTNDGISLAQTADGALASISSNLQRVRELAVQSANGSNSDADRAALQAEAIQLIAENDRIASQTQFNGNKLLDGGFNAQLFQVGANRAQTVTANAIASMRSDALGSYNGFTNAGVFNPVPGAPSNLTITLNGPGTSYTVNAVQTDAVAITDAINSAGVPGLSSVLSSHFTNHAQTSVGAVSGTASITLNGATFNVDYVAGSSATAQQARLSAVAAAINQQSAATGVAAVIGPPGLLLLQNTGSNTTISYNAGTATGSVATDFGLVAGTSTQSTQIFYRAPIGSGVTSITVVGAGMTSSTTTVTQTGQSLANLNISTVAGATAALDSLDNALQSVSEARANLGALQNRFASAIGNLQTSSENLSAARSRIVDADFAQETATLSRAQILQQASTAMVAQANQSPQGVLALLR